MKKINIEVSGLTGSGKSRVIFLIKEALREHGIKITHNPAPDYSYESIFDSYMSRNLDEAMQAISNKSEVIISERRPRRRVI